MGTNQNNNNTPFIEERDRRFKMLSDLGLWQEITETVRINGKPLSVRTAKDTFKVNSYAELKDSMLRVWIFSTDLLDKYQENFNQYADEHGNME